MGLQAVQAVLYSPGWPLIYGVLLPLPPEGWGYWYELPRFAFSQATLKRKKKHKGRLKETGETHQQP